MAYTVLARRYRSRTFDQLVGQEAIAATLRAAIALDRVAHAYLFTGTRGVGKTSSARIFANAVNNPADDPALAEAIFAGRDTDVIEIDAASNNSVENARQLIDGSVYRPLRGRKKIYIIDEVHMLSQAAFNALLKTMEEPPDHVVFVLCTTETHKVPATIQSRCQRFDFRDIPPGRIAAHLRAVASAESIDADDELLAMVARLAAGSMRDALSLLDRLIAAGQPRLTPELLEGLLGLPPRTLVLELTDAIASARPDSALLAAEALLRASAGTDQFFTTLAEFFRDLMVLSACGPATELVDLSGEARELAVSMAARFDPGTLSHMIALCEGVARSAKSSSFPRALVDTLVVRLALAKELTDAAAIAAEPLQRAAAPPTQAAPAARTRTAHPGSAAAKKA
ncbi:MAG: DNA polymerase III, subunit gamma and tau [Planctomyces sp.]|nr:DNA polymerase III, subunit gamma and tau [Planctomyces sp.]